MSPLERLAAQLRPGKKASRAAMMDHIVPLKRGAADSPGNMQSSAAAKVGDQVE